MTGNRPALWYFCWVTKIPHLKDLCADIKKNNNPAKLDHGEQVRGKSEPKRNPKISGLDSSGLLAFRLLSDVLSANLCFSGKVSPLTDSIVPHIQPFLCSLYLNFNRVFPDFCYTIISIYLLNSRFICEKLGFEINLKLFRIMTVFICDLKSRYINIFAKIRWVWF